MNQTTLRERILVYGSFKIGKSFCWLSIAEALYQAGNTDVHFYVVDTDFGAEKMMREGFEHLSDMMTIYTPMDFDELLTASKDIQKRAQKQDWVVIDMLSYAWTEAQEFYIQGVYGDEPENYFIQMRKEVTAKGGKDKRAYGGHEGTDWGFITKVYKRFEQPLTVKGNWNVFAVTGEKKLDPDRGASTDMVKQYKAVGGMAPEGQKGIGHRFDTVLRMTKRANGQRELTMVGDRGREGEGSRWEELGTRVIQIDAPPKAFARRYLVDIAGWEREKKKSKKSDTKSSTTDDKPKRASSVPNRRRR